MRTYNWGIVGLGKIARKFADDLRLLPNARLHAVASSSLDRAQAFAAEYGAPLAFGSYEELAQCPDLDVVYIATPHTEHARCTMLCLEHGRAVLCEKPFAMHLGEAQKMVEMAREKRLFLMEALWTLFIPAVERALELQRNGSIGEVHTVQSDFGFKAPFDPEWRLFNPRLGGGALLDIGIYPAMLSLQVLGAPDPADIQAVATRTATGVDETVAFQWSYPGNRLALAHATLAATTPVEARIFGTEGTLHLHPRWHHAQRLSRWRYHERTQIEEVEEYPYEGWGYHFEAAHVMQCLEQGLTESPRIPLDFTLQLTATLDAIRAKIGLEYFT
jgi:predicted dehydrogenase